MQITISGATMTELKHNMREAAVALGIEGYVDAPSAPAAEDSMEDKPRRGRPRKEVAEPVAAAPAEVKPSATVAAQPAPAAEPKVSVTKDEVMKVATALNGAKGMNAVREVLGKFGAAKLSELKEANYDAFIVACKAAT